MYRPNMFCSLFIEQLPNHPDYRTVSAKDVAEVKKVIIQFNYIFKWLIFLWSGMYHIAMV